MRKSDCTTMSPKSGRRTFQVLVASAAIVFSAQSLAQIEEIVVTAQKREQNLQDVAVSVSALPEEALRDRAITDFATYLRSVPGTTFADQGNQGSEVKIRGIGNGTSRLSPTVAVYLGDVPVIHNGRSINSSYDFYITDMARIEVLRGPQGQLYGSNSLGGAIKNVPNKANLSDFAITGSTSWAAMNGGSDSYNGDITVNIPLTDTTGMRITGYSAQQGGWIDNIFAGGTRIGDGSRPTDLYIPTAPSGPTYPPQLFALPVRFLTVLVDKVASDNPADYDRVINYVSPSNARRNVNETTRSGLRGMFTWEATDALTVDVMLAYEDKDNNGTSWVTNVPAIPGPYPYNGRGPQTYAIPRPTTIDPGSTLPPAWNPTLYPTSAKAYQQVNAVDAGNSDKISLANLVLNWDLDFATLTSSTSYWDRTAVLETPLPLAYIATGVDGIWPVFNRRTDNPQAFIQELRLTSSEKGPLTWIGGAFYSDISQDFRIDVIDPTGFMMINLWPPRPPRPPPWPAGTELGTTKGKFDDQQVALFGEVAYDVTPSVNVALSFRWYDIKQSADIVYTGEVFNSSLLNTPTNRDNSESGFLPKATVSWKPTDDALVYLTAAEGWRSGVVNEELPKDACKGALTTLGYYPDGLPDTKPDTVWNYELGAKMAFADRRVTVNGAIYQIDWNDLQSQVFLQSLQGPNPPPSEQCVYDRLINVGSATIRGAELEVAFQATDSLRVDTSVAYTHGEYNDPYAALEIDAGDTIEGTARVTAYVGLQYDFKLLERDGFVRTDYTYTGDIAAKPTDFTDQPLAYPIGEFQTVNLRGAIGLTDKLRFELFASNLFNEFGVSRAIDLDGAAPPTYFTIPPRTVGATLRFTF